MFCSRRDLYLSGRSALSPDHACVIVNYINDGFDLYRTNAESATLLYGQAVTTLEDIPIPIVFLDGTHVLLGSTCGQVAIVCVDNGQVVDTLVHDGQLLSPYAVSMSLVLIDRILDEDIVQAIVRLSAHMLT